MILDWLLGNGAAALMFALAVTLLGRALSSRPGLMHALWLVAMAVLLMPALPLVDTPGAVLRRQVRALVEEREPAAGAPDEPSVAVGRLDVAPLAAGRFEPRPTAPVDGGHAPAPTQPRRSEARRALELTDAAPALWALGALAVLLVSARRIARFRRLLASAPAAPVPAALRAEVRAVARRLGVRAPRVRVLEGIPSPCIWCFGRPLLLWPAGADTTPAERTTLIAHELAHLARRDHWVARSEVPAAALFWWNPLFWWIRGRIRTYAELSCDAWAVWAYPADRRAFAGALIEMQARTASAPVALHGLGATDTELEDFERRLNMIMVKRVSPTVSRRPVAAALLAAVLASPGYSGGDGAEAASSRTAVSTRVESVQCFEQAEVLFEAKEHDQALEGYLTVLALVPDHARAHARAGYLLVGRRELAPAVEHFERQYQLGYERPTALYNTACAKALAGEADAAIEYVAAAVRHGFSNVELMGTDQDLASVREDERYQAQVARAEAALALEEELWQLQEEDADALLYLDGHRELVELRSADGALALRHGHLALKAKDYEQAAWAFGRQAKLGHKPDYGYYNLACARALAGEVDAAIADLERAAAAGMSHAGILEDSDLDACREDARFAALEDRIATPALESKKVKLLAKQGDLQQALALLAEMCEDEQSSLAQRVWAAQTHGRLLIDAGRYDEALAVLDDAANLGEAVDQSAFLIAEVQALRGEDAASLRYVEYALALGFAEPERVRALLGANAHCKPEEVEALAAKAQKRKTKAKYGEQKKKEKWSQGEATPVSHDS